VENQQGRCKPSNREETTLLMQLWRREEAILLQVGVKNASRMERGELVKVATRTRTEVARAT
jgi:hypothetical protein